MADLDAAPLEETASPSPAAGHVPRVVVSHAIMSSVAVAGRGSRSLTRDQFQAACTDALAGVPNIALYLAAEEATGVLALGEAAHSALGGLWDQLVAARGGSTAFSAAALADLANDAGFAGDVHKAYAFLSDSRAVASGAAALPSPPAVVAKAGAGASTGSGGVVSQPLVAGSPGLAPPPTPAAALRQPHLSTPVPLEREEFVQYLAAAASAGQVDEGRVPEYTRLFTMLHLSGMRERGGVASVGAGSK